MQGHGVLWLLFNPSGLDGAHTYASSDVRGSCGWFVCNNFQAQKELLIMMVTLAPCVLTQQQLPAIPTIPAVVKHGIQPFTNRLLNTQNSGATLAVPAGHEEEKNNLEALPYR